MLQYVEEEYLGELCAVDRALPLDDYEPSYPRADRSVPLIVHAPSHMLTKGTVAVLRAIDRLAGQLSFDVDLVHGVPRAEALRRMQRCDIFIDQLIVGDFGMAALEAMALGKPVVAYVKPSLRERYPSELPVVDATPESLESVLRSLLTDPAKRTELGRLGRRFVEEHADARSRAVRLTEVYGAARSRARRGSVHD
jgi:glycosyltransferase involved in cell wall biosynthesis